MFKLLNQIPGTIILCRIPETINFWVSALATTKISAQEHWLSVKCNSSIVQGPGSKNWRTSYMSHTVHHHLISRYFQLHQIHSWSGRTNYHHLHGNSERHQLTSLGSPLLGLQWLSRSMVYAFIKPNQRVPKWMVHVTLMLMISVHYMSPFGI